jgi:hypothetical protein
MARLRKRATAKSRHGQKPRPISGQTVGELLDAWTTAIDQQGKVVAETPEVVDLIATIASLPDDHRKRVLMVLRFVVEFLERK